MDTIETICSLLEVKCFIGTFACDKLPVKFKFPCSFIANTDNSNFSGTHWVAFYYDENGVGEYFDSFGIFPIKEEFLIHLKCFSKRQWSYNKTILQTPNIKSFTCGHFCILYILLKSKGHSLQEIISLFTKDTILNDLFVANIVNHFDKCAH